MAFLKYFLKNHLVWKVGICMDEWVVENKFILTMIFNVRRFHNGELNISKGTHIFYVCAVPLLYFPFTLLFS